MIVWIFKYAVYNTSTRISSPISLVIFQYLTEISESFHEKRGSSYSQVFGIQKRFLNLVVWLFFADNRSSVGRSITFRVSAYRWRNTVIQLIAASCGFLINDLHLHTWNSANIAILLMIIIFITNIIIIVIIIIITMEWVIIWIIIHHTSK